ncbi:AraC family ligand binding domain-containing protein, partial [Citrobacter amalonaticus]|uniref:AraC family ligand binding domain-containing protein n=1 Tax=Citrobacter amalonaticus TaxID=35703 RepID=UPI000B0B1817
MTHTRDIPQSFWRDERLAWLELRSTWRSHQAYKRHHHPQLSVGAILEGETCCVSDGKEYRLQVGDLIVIPPRVPHSCNPVDGQCRSYPFSAFLRLDDSAILSLSPERFILLADGDIQTRPIKGTLPRLPQEEADRKQAQKLANSAK